MTVIDLTAGNGKRGLGAGGVEVAGTAAGNTAGDLAAGDIDIALRVEAAAVGIRIAADDLTAGNVQRTAGIDGDAAALIGMTAKDQTVPDVHGAVQSHGRATGILVGVRIHRCRYLAGINDAAVHIEGRPGVEVQHTAVLGLLGSAVVGDGATVQIEATIPAGVYRTAGCIAAGSACTYDPAATLCVHHREGTVIIYIDRSAVSRGLDHVVTPQVKAHIHRIFFRLSVGCTHLIAGGNVQILTKIVVAAGNGLIRLLYHPCRPVTGIPRRSAVGTGFGDLLFFGLCRRRQHHHTDDHSSRQQQ